jgi:tetratricopeptide (TPR) repeat protein
MAEKSLNELPRELRMLYNKGNDALQRENFDYAMDLFCQVLAREPGLYECRKALRQAQFRKNGEGKGFFKKMLSSASASPQVAKAQLALHKNPAEALEIAEQILNSDPTNGAAHKIVVEVAHALDFPRTAALSLEVLAKNSPKDCDIAIKFANSLADAGDPVRAESILASLVRSSPHNNELAQALKNISARRTMQKGGYDALADGSGSYRDILKDKEEAVSLEQQSRQVKTEDVAARQISELEARIKTEPNNLRLLRSLAELYTQKNQFDQALANYQKIKATEAGADASLDTAIAETTKRKFDFEISQLDPNAPDFKDQSAKLQAQKEAYLLSECQKRAERFPTDLQIRFDLALLYFQAGKMSEAIAEFQKARNNPHRRVQSLNYLGQCYARRNMNDLAIRTFEEGLKEKVVFDDEKKELIYNLACVFEKMGKREEAIKQFEVIYGVDAGYKDVGTKIDGFYGAQG